MPVFRANPTPRFRVTRIDAASINYAPLFPSLSVRRVISQPETLRPFDAVKRTVRAVTFGG